MKTYMLTLKWNHRKFGPDQATWRVNANNMSIAIGRGTREWLKSMETRTRRDAGKELTVIARCLGPVVDTGTGGAA
jgi:hypothetical protein